MKTKMRVLCLFLLLVCAIRTEGFSVRGPAMPLLVQLGASVTLPCSVHTPIPLHELEVRWMREDSGALVHLFQEEDSRPESQSPPYRDRAAFFTEEISKGNYSLLLRNITTEDKGLYKCVVHSEHGSSETKVKMETEWLFVAGAEIPLFAYVGEDVILNCSVDTHVPLRELEVEWIKTNREILVLLFADGQNRPESQHESFRGRAEFFREEIPKGNFSLKLRDVKTEDKGEYMCKVHTDRESVNATAWLQELGFSTLHMCILGSSIAAAVFAILSCIPAVWCINKGQKEKNKKGIMRKDDVMDQGVRTQSQDGVVEGKRSRAVLLYCLQVSIPCILLSIAFAIWGKIESSVGEAYVCSTINLMRILVILKVAPYVLPGTCFKRLTNVALPLESFLLRTGINSVVLHTVWSYHAPDVVRKVFSCLMYGVMIIYDLSAVCSSGLMFSTGYDYLKYSIFSELFFLILTRTAHGFTAVFLFWFLVPDIRYLLDCWKSDGFFQRHKYLIAKVIEALKFILDSTANLLFLYILSGEDKEKPAFMCFIAFLYIVTAILAFDHRSDLPAVSHILIYVFGSAVLSVLNSVALATEVFLKAEKGERTVEDFRGIILTLESLFLACWLGIQMYAYCMQDEKMREQLGLIFPRCIKQVQSPTSQQDQMAQEAVEMEALPPAAQNITQAGGNFQWWFGANA